MQYSAHRDAAGGNAGKELLEVQEEDANVSRALESLLVEGAV
jgi:hypothetical protein